MWARRSWRSRSLWDVDSDSSFARAAQISGHRPPVYCSLLSFPWPLALSCFYSSSSERNPQPVSTLTKIEWKQTTHTRLPTGASSSPPASPRISLAFFDIISWGLVRGVASLGAYSPLQTVPSPLIHAQHHSVPDHAYNGDHFSPDLAYHATRVGTITYWSLQYLCRRFLC